MARRGSHSGPRMPLQAGSETRTTLHWPQNTAVYTPSADFAPSSTPCSCPVTVKPFTLGWASATSLGPLPTTRGHLSGQPPKGSGPVQSGMRSVPPPARLAWRLNCTTLMSLSRSFAGDWRHQGPRTQTSSSRPQSDKRSCSGCHPAER